MARRSEPASTRTEAPTPAPERRPAPAPARRPQEAPARKADEAGTIKAIVIDPAKRTIRETRILTSPGDERGGFGRQLDEKTVERLVGAAGLEAIDLGDGQVVIADEMRQSQGETMEWTLCEAAEPIAGVGVVVSYDPEADEYADATMSLDEARKAIKWGADDAADTDDIRSAIDERLDALDGRQLKRLLAMMDEGALDEGEEAER